MFSIIIPLSLALLQWNRIPQRWSAIRWIILVSLLCDFLGYLSSQLFHNSFVVGNFYLVVQFTLIFYILNNLFTQKKLLIFIYVTYLVYYIINLLFFEDFVMLLGNANSIGGLIVILMLLYFFYQQLNAGNSESIHKTPINLILFAFLFYYCGTLFVFLTSNYFLSFLKGTNFQIWMIHNFCNILKNILIAVALWLNYKLIRSSTVQ
jgi:hypothetical protein